MVAKEVAMRKSGNSVPPKSSSATQIAVAVIGEFAVIGAAVLSNWGRRIAWASYTAQARFAIAQLNDRAGTAAEGTHAATRQ